MAIMSVVTHKKEYIEHKSEHTSFQRTKTNLLQRKNSRLIVSKSFDESNTSISIAQRRCDTLPSHETEQIYHAYFQRHHIIPQCLWAEEIGQQLQMLGFKKDDDINMVSLPSSRNIPDAIKNFSTPSKPNMSFDERSSISSIHSGKHLASYLYYVLINLREILSAEIDNMIKISNITNFLSEAKDHLLNGTLKLQQETENEIVAYGHDK